jgi:serine/threonine protein kinase
VRNGNENLKREIRCIKLVKHYNVIKLFDVIDEEGNDKVYLVFELANLFSLQVLKCLWALKYLT